MLQQAIKTLSDETYDLPAAVQIGEELKQAASRLHDALAQMEGVIASPRPAAPGGEEALLRAENRQLKESEARLARQLEDMRAQHQGVSKQVAALSARLEALTAHLAKLLEE